MFKKYREIGEGDTITRSVPLITNVVFSHERNFAHVYFFFYVLLTYSKFSKRTNRTLTRNGAA